MERNGKMSRLLPGKGRLALLEQDPNAARAAAQPYLALREQPPLDLVPDRG